MFKDRFKYQNVPPKKHTHLKQVKKDFVVGKKLTG